jgi:pimeloyl-ACP methyl ester carboxylesterase
MPYAINQGVRIHFKVEGEGPPLVVHHGFNGSLEDFYNVADFVQVLKGNYQLILIDARGHGASDKPHDPESYRMVLRVADVVTVLDALNVSKAHFIGYSMGGQVGFGIAKYAPERFLSLLIGGAEPYQEASDKPDPFLEILSMGVEAYVAAMDEMFGARMTPKLKSQLLANDIEALTAYLSLREPWGFEDILPTIATPCLLLAGENDPFYVGAKKCSKIIPNATFVSLPGLDHIEAAFRIDLTLPHIQMFLAEVSQVQPIGQVSIPDDI